LNWRIREAVRQLHAGGIIAYPTETVYGLGCDPFNGDAVLHLLSLKQRAMSQGVILIASELAQLKPLLLPLQATTKKRIKGTSSKPVTWILPCRPETPVWLRGEHDSLAIRITSHPLANELCKAWGRPLVSTSANVHGRKPATSAIQVHKAFNNQLGCILYGPQGNNIPSQIRDGLTGKLLGRGGSAQ
jgi:L-threonylcarbamoyladenylate synthase